MSRFVRWLLWGIALLVVGYFAWWWFSSMERQTIAIPAPPSYAAQENPLLAAERFLHRRGLAVAGETTLYGMAKRLGHRDVVIVPSFDATLPTGEQQALLRWVRGGGVFVTSITKVAKEEGEDGGDGAKVESTTLVRGPLLSPLKLQVLDADPKHPPMLQVRPPTSPYALSLDDQDSPRLAPSADVPPAWQNDTGGRVLAYRQGKGWLVLLTNDRLFDQGSLSDRDHAEFLWRLATLNPGKVWLVQAGGGAKSWYEQLWAKWPQAILTLAVLILLALWRKGVRFGPILPEAPSNRRALLEHIRASARWAWRREGQAQLLQAARRATQAQINARMPELARLPPDELARRLAKRFDLPQADVETALYKLIPAHPAAFAAAVATLQTLRTKL